MAERPTNTRTANVINPGFDKRIPLGFVDIVIDNETNQWVGFIKDGKFYNLGDKVVETAKPTKAKNREIKRVEDAIDAAYQEVEGFQVDMDMSQPGSAEYNQAKANRDRARDELDRLRSERNLALAREDDANTQRELQQEQQKRQRDADAGRSTESSDKKIDDLRKRQTTVRQSITSLEAAAKVAPTQAAPSFGPPEVRGGRAVPGTGGAVAAPTVVTPSVTTATKPVVTTTPTSTTTPTAGRGTTAAGVTTGGKGGKGGKKQEEVPAETIESVLEDAKSKYGGIDEVFRTNPELQTLLKRAIGKVGDPTDDYEPARFLSELENTTWWKSNAGPIRQRGFYKRQYDDLVKTLKTDDPNYQAALDELNKTSEYGRGLSSVISTVKNTARAQGVQLDDTTATIVAKNLYDYANEGDATKIREAVLGAGKFGGGNLYTGQAGINIRTLRDIAAANGIDFDTQFSTSKDTWLSRIAQGESIETFKDIIRKTAQNAWNLDDRTRALLDQGVDLETIYSPFKKTMATILELPEEKITLNDLASKGVIGGEKPMNLYDFRKALRQDERWQYTENARTEMSNLTENLLRDFGFVR
jgi:hypothetical protein